MKGELTLTQMNHLYLDLRMPMRESTLLEVLGTLPPSACLRTLSFDWPLGLFRRDGNAPVSTPAVSPGFFARRLCEVFEHVVFVPAIRAFEDRLRHIRGPDPGRAAARGAQSFFFFQLRFFEVGAAGQSGSPVQS